MLPVTIPMRKAVIRRLPVVLPVFLAVALAVGCHRSGETSGSQARGPSELQKLGASAMAKARHWHSDAILVNVEVKNQGSQAQTILEFYAPSDLSGYIITAGLGPESEQAVGGASWGTQPIAADFPDLSDAVAAMRARGMRGEVAGGTLSGVKLCGIMPAMRWLVSPANTNQPLNDYSVNFYADPQTVPDPMDWHQADDLADKAVKGDASALASLSEAAEHGDANAATNLGYVYAVGGSGVAQNFAQAGPWFCAAAYEGSPAAQFDLGLMYENAKGVDRGWIDESGKLYYPAAMQTLPEAELNFGVRVWRVQAPNSAANAQQWWQKAAAGGLDAGTKNIAAIHSWNSQQTPYNMVPLVESTTFIEARNWNPSSKGLIPYSSITFPERFPAGWDSAQE